MLDMQGRLRGAVTYILDDNAIVSYGGGVNSTGLVIHLVNMSWRGRIIMADTGAEWPETEEFVALFEREWLAPRGLCVEHVGAEWRAGGRKKWALPEYCEKRNIIPLASRRWCTIEYKVSPIARWCEAHGVTTQYLGISADESHRMPDAVRPLCDDWLTRRDCVRIIKAERLPIPPRSKCWLCTFQTEAEWRRLWQRHPDLYARAEALEAGAKRTGTGRYRATLDPGGKVTLADRRAKFEREMVLEAPG